MSNFCHVLIALLLGVIGRLFSVIVAFPGHTFSILFYKNNRNLLTISTLMTKLSDNKGLLFFLFP